MPPHVRLSTDEFVAKSRGHWRIAAVALPIVVVALALRACFAFMLDDGDMELFVYMGKLVAGGGLIGVDLIDNKLPTVGLLMATPWRLLGANWLGYALLSMAMTVVAVAAIVRAIRLVHPSSTWPTAAMATAWMCFPVAVMAPFKLEHVQLMFGALAAMAIVQCWRRMDWRDALTAGLCAGVSAMAKPSGLAVVVAAAVAFAVWGRPVARRRAGLMIAGAAGVAVPVFVCGVYLFMTRSFDTVLLLMKQVHDYGRNSVWIPSQVLTKFVCIVGMFGVPMLMRWWGERRWRVEPAPADRWVLTLFAATWLSLEFLAIAMQGRMYGYHFLPMTAPAALLFGLILREPRPMTLIGATAPVLLMTIAWTIHTLPESRVPSDRLAAIDYIERHADANDGVWMDDVARILVESDLRPGSRLPLTFVFSNSDEAPIQFSNLLLKDLATRKPRWIVIRNDLPKWLDFYQRGEIEFANRPVRGQNLNTAWRRIDRFVGEQYVVENQVGTMNVMRLRFSASAIETAAAEKSPIAE